MVVTHLDSLNRALHRALSDDPEVLLIGEDLLDPYGGAFKVTRGLSTEFPDRVWTTPVSEALIVGLAGGLAMRGFKPVVEIMFGDFVMLAADQIVNHLTKYPGMYNMQVEVPVVIRAPMGGGRGYGPTHSQSLERHFLGLPHMTILSPSIFHDPGEILSAVLWNSRYLTLFLEHKLLYPAPIGGKLGPWRVTSLANGRYPTLSVQRPGADLPEVVVIGYGGASLLVEQTLARLEEEEIVAEGVFPCVLSPMQLDPVISRTLAVGRAVVVEEGIQEFGWGSHVIAEVHKASVGHETQVKVKHVGALTSILPSPSSLEFRVLPNLDRVLAAVWEVIQ